MRLLILFIFLVFVSACSLTAELPPASEKGVQYPAAFVVTSPAALLYDRASSTVGKPGLAVGEKVEVVGHQNRWYRIKYQGQNYFVLESFLIPVPTRPAPEPK